MQPLFVETFSHINPIIKRKMAASLVRLQTEPAGCKSCLHSPHALCDHQYFFVMLHSRVFINTMYHQINEHPVAVYVYNIFNS